MAIAKIYTIRRTRADQGDCGKCGEPIKKGDPYLWWARGYRTGARAKRCMKPECFPKNYERENSLLSTVMQYQETFDESQYDTADGLAEAMQQLYDEMTEVGEQYRAAGTNANGVEWNQDMIQRADTLTEADEPPQLDEEPQDGEDEDEWLERIRQEARDWVDAVELP